MKKMLIISYLFAPENAIGAIRPTKIAKYLSEKKYEVTVVTTSQKMKKDTAFSKDISNIKKIIELNHSGKHISSDANTLTNVMSSINIKSKSRIRLKELRYFKRQYLLFLKSFDFFKQFKKEVKRNLIDINEFDYLFTSYGPISSILIGLWIKKKYPAIIWINDFRDPMVVKDTPFIFKNIYRWLQKKSCEKADYIVAISNGCLKKICQDNFKNKSFVLTNGFDNDDLPRNIESRNLYNFSFVYVGALYEGKRDLSILFEVLRELVNKGAIKLIDIVFNYAGTDFNVLKSQARKFQLESILVNNGVLSRRKSIQLQNRSAVLVLSTWNTKEEEGVLTGKFFEYMLMNKPIIALVNGNKGESETKKIINKCDIGIVYEQINHYNDYMILKNYIVTKYKEFKDNNRIEHDPRRDVIEEYNYKGIVNEFERNFLYKNKD